MASCRAPVAREKHQGVTARLRVFEASVTWDGSLWDDDIDLRCRPTPRVQRFQAQTDLGQQTTRRQTPGISVPPGWGSWCNPGPTLGAPSALPPWPSPPMFPGGPLAALAGASAVTGGARLYDYIVHRAHFPEVLYPGLDPRASWFWFDSARIHSSLLWNFERTVFAGFFPLPLLTAVDRHLIFIPASPQASFPPSRQPSEQRISIHRSTSSALPRLPSLTASNIRPG